MDVILARLNSLNGATGSRRPLATLVLVVGLLLRSRLLDIPKEVVEKLRAVRKGNKLTPDQLSTVLQQVYVKEADGSKTLLVPYLDRVSKVSVACKLSLISLTVVVYR